MFNKRTREALEALYGNGKIAPATTKKAVKNETPTEKEEHLRLMKLVSQHPLLNKLLIHIPNEGKRSIGYAVTLLNLGLRPGVSDFFLPVPRGTFHGLWVELKRTKGGRVSPEQKEWLDLMREQGYRAEVALGCDAAWAIFLEYLNG